MEELSESERWWSVAEVMKYLGVSRATLYTYMGDGSAFLLHQGYESTTNQKKRCWRTPHSGQI
jgi:hypothetical protein